jgi:hypothetical protein
LGLIEKIGILGDQIDFLPSQLVQIKGKIVRKSKFSCELRVKLQKFAISNHFTKRCQTMGTQLIEIKGEIEEN